MGLRLQPAKSQCYIAEALRNEEWNTARGNIPNGMLKDAAGEEIRVDGASLYGITTCNIPIGSELFVKG